MTTWLFQPTTEEPAPSDVLDVTLRFEGDVTVCVLAGRLCAYTAPTLDAWLGQLHENQRDLVIVDVSKLTSISGDGVDVFVAHAERVRSTGGRIAVRSPSSATQRVLQLCGAGALVEDAIRPD